jgi:hypothetical protein
MQEQAYLVTLRTAYFTVKKVYATSPQQAEERAKWGGITVNEFYGEEEEVDSCHLDPDAIGPDAEEVPHA